MATTVDYTQRFGAPPAEVWQMMTDPEYIRTKALRSGSLEVNAEVTDDDGETRIVSHRVLPAEIPSFMKKVVGDQLIINETQRWSPAADDGSRSGSFLVDFGGQPLAFKGTLSLRPTAEGTEVQTNGSLKASVRFIGGKVEGVAQEWSVKYLRKEEEVAADWLTTH